MSIRATCQRLHYIHPAVSLHTAALCVSKLLESHQKDGVSVAYLPNVCEERKRLFVGTDWQEVMELIKHDREFLPTLPNTELAI